MIDIKRTVPAIAIMLAFGVVACNSTTGPTDRGEAGESGHHEEGEGEESGTQLALNEAYDQVRNGARLMLRYDAPSNSFVGSLQRP